MKISEAVNKALEKNGALQRESLRWTGVLIIPTNSSECCCILPTKSKHQQPGRCWNPTADDLMADDWEVVKIQI